MTLLGLLGTSPLKSLRPRQIGDRQFVISTLDSMGISAMLCMSPCSSDYIFSKWSLAYSLWGFPTILYCGAFPADCLHRSWIVTISGTMTCAGFPAFSQVYRQQGLTVSRRSEPSSRTTLIGEQPNHWELLHPQDVMSRHRTLIHNFVWCRLYLHLALDRSTAFWKQHIIFSLM